MKRWIDKLKSNPPSVDMRIQPSESLPPESNAPWPTWKTFNWLRSGVGRTNANLIKWGYHTGDSSCNCGTETQTMEHLLQCPLLKTPCSCDDLSIFKDTAQKCVKLWQSTIWRHDTDSHRKYILTLVVKEKVAHLLLHQHEENTTFDNYPLLSSIILESQQTCLYFG